MNQVFRYGVVVCSILVNKTNNNKQSIIVISSEFSILSLQNQS